MATTFSWQPTINKHNKDSNHTAVQEVDGKTITHSAAMYNNLKAGRAATRQFRYNSGLANGRLKPLVYNKDKRFRSNSPPAPEAAKTEA